MKNKYRILIADDHQFIRKGLKLSLEEQDVFIPEIIEVSDGLEVIEKVQEERFDVVLLDVNMPRKDGIAVTNYMKAKNDPTPILALTMHNEPHIIKQMVDAGVNGYLLKNCGIEELTNAITTVISRKKYFTNEASQVLLSKKVFVKSEDNYSYPAKSVLTLREREVLALITEELTNQEIADRLNVSKRTVDGHRNRMLDKLKVKNTAGLVKYALLNGIGV